MAWDYTDDPLLREAQREVDELLGVPHVPTGWDTPQNAHAALRVARERHLPCSCYLDNAETRTAAAVFWFRFQCGAEVEVTPAQVEVLRRRPVLPPPDPDLITEIRK